MPTVLEIFKDITKLQRCSGNHKEFIEYVQNLSKKLGYICLVDDVFNILCKKENSKANIVFQSHYDIVCLKENCVPQIIEDETTLQVMRK
jgi:dipeptidase D